MNAATPRYRHLAIGLLVLLILTSRTTAASTEGLIVPGQSLGGLRLGTPVAALYQMPGWGQPDRVHTSGSISYATYNRRAVTVAVRDSVVVLILTTSERYRTEKGVGVGLASSVVAGLYGPGSAGGDGRTTWYDAVGLVVITGGGTIIRLGVYDPKTFVRAILADEQPARDVFLTARPLRTGEPDAAQTDAAGGTGRVTVIAVTLKNASRATKVLNPNFFVLTDRNGQSYKYDRSTFSRKDACRSTVTARPGESRSCTLVFALPAGRLARSVTFDDGGSLDEFFF
ncbi:MAG: DUF4352 domain-containing protein [Armatimonadota bacterium]|nr:DUF4352 domain-containing protein [Armatimonadota bacterium]